MAVLPLGLIGLVVILVVFVLGGMGLSALLKEATTGRKIGVAVLVVAVVAIAGLLVLNAIQGRQRHRSPGITTVVNLKQIGLGILMYAEDHGGQLPPTLGTVYPYVGDGQVFLTSWESKTAEPKSGTDVDAGQCDFLYTGAGWQAASEHASEIGVAQTKPGYPYPCVLFLDGHVEAGEQAMARARKAAEEIQLATEVPAEGKAGEQ